MHPRIVQKPGKPKSRKGWKRPYSPLFLYKWDTCLAELRKKKSFEYRNPVTGGPVMPTMGARLERIKGSTKPIRHTGSAIYQVASGHGWSEIGEERFEWEEKDVFVVPAWTRYRHGASAEAVLFSFNDFPAMRALSLYREAGE